MPIVVSYDAIDALGPLALTAGYQGAYGGQYAQSRERQLDRRNQDTRFLLGNTFENQRLGMQQDFAAEQANLSRGFQSSERALDREFQAGRDDVRMAMEQFQAQATSQRQTEQNILESNLKGLDERRKLDLEKNAFIQNAVRIGQNPDDAEKAWARSQYEKETATGNFARRSQQGQTSGLRGLVGTIGGNENQDAIVAANNSILGRHGAASSLIDSLRNKSGIPGGDRQLMVNNALNYIQLAAAEGGYTEEQLQMAIQGEKDPEVKAALQAAQWSLIQKKSMPVNQTASPTTGGPGVGIGGGASINIKPATEMTTEELIREAMSFR